MELVRNEVLRRLRLDRQLTQAQVADRVQASLLAKTGRIHSFDANRVSKLERGEITWPDRHYREALAEIFHTDQLGFYATKTRRDADEVIATDRRTFMAMPAAAVVPVLLSPQPPARIGRADIAEFDTRINSLATLQRMAGGGATRALCTPEMRRAVALAKHCSMTPAIRTCWYRSIARLAGTAAWAAFDDSAEQEALSHLDDGMNAAEQACDPALTAFLAEIGARLHVQMRRPALALAELRRAAGPVPPGVAAASAALAARALALTGDVRGVTREITAADRAFARLGSDTSALVSYANEGKHAADCADAFFDLAVRTGRPDPELVRRLHASLDLTPADRARTRAVASAKLASVMFKVKNRQEGDRWALMARGAAAGVQSSRLRLVLSDMNRDRRSG